MTRENCDRRSEGQQLDALVEEVEVPSGPTHISVNWGKGKVSMNCLGYHL